MKLKAYIWPTIGLSVVAFCLWLLYRDLRGLSLTDVTDSLQAISGLDWVLAAGGAVLAYAALAGYDRIALLHLRKPLPWLFITACSFTAYALAHNIGASVLSGAVVRYRAYTSQGLSGAEVGVLVALCSFTFMLGTILLGGVVLMIAPEISDRFIMHLPLSIPSLASAVMLGFVFFYVLGGWLHFPPLRIGSFRIHYPRLPIIANQLVVGPLELIGAASIIYFALPEAGNPGFLTVLGIFLASFSAALLSHAPGGLGVLEVLFLAGLPEISPAEVLAALLVFRLFYLLIPLALSVVVILLFERSQ
ncbi:MAG: lysylphosphatidylglycerol synthase transmembrane domain-containing protein, partial [Geminicoccales bacterium]